MKSKRSFYLLFSIFSLAIIAFFASNINATYATLSPKGNSKQPHQTVHSESEGEQVHSFHL